MEEVAPGEDHLLVRPEHLVRARNRLRLRLRVRFRFRVRARARVRVRVRVSTSAATVAGTSPPKRQRASDGAPEALNGPEMLSRPSRCSIGPRLALVPLGRPKGSGYG